jgi:class 3 adenylate cyclase
MFTDIKGFTERTSATSREELVGLLKKHDSLLIPVINKFSGTIVKTIGDAFLVTFDSPTNAVLCGIMIQQNLRDYNAGRKESEMINIRVSVNMGEVEIRDGDVFGEAVNIAARLEGVTEASEIYFTESVYLAMNKAEVPSSEVGSFRLKGIPEAIKVYRVIQDTNSDNFQKIIERLRGDTFADVSIPSAGGGFAHGFTGGRRANGVKYITALIVVIVLIYAAFFMRTAGRDYKRCLESLSRGDIAHAALIAEDMLKVYPSAVEAMDAVKKVAIYKIEAEKNKNNFEKAHNIIQETKAQYKWLELDEEEKNLLLFEAGYYSQNDNYRGVSNAYYRLEQKYPDDAVVLNSIIDNCGAGAKNGPDSRAVYAAIKLCEINPGVESSDNIVKTLIYGFKDNDYKSKTAARLRAALKSCFKGADEQMRRLFASQDIKEKSNGYIYLKENGLISEIDEYNYYYGILLNCNSSNHAQLNDAFNYFEALVNKGALDKLKKESAAPGVSDKINGVAILSENSYISGSVAVILQKAFWNEIKDGAAAWASDNKDYYLRINAYNILKNADKLDMIDMWAFHKRSLESFEPAFIPDYFDDAVSYFAGFADNGGVKKSEAGDILSVCAEYVKKRKAEYEVKNYKDYAGRAKINLDKLEAALKNF